MICIREVPGANVGWQGVFAEVFLAFAQFLQTTCPFRTLPHFSCPGGGGGVDGKSRLAGCSGCEL
jgi:hypothetical protein